MAQAVSRRPLTAEVRVLSQVFPCGIYGRQNGSGTGFSPVTSVFPVSAVLTVLHALFLSYYRRKKK
jgi:hypothetical protein